jgi:hypothetical protein
MATRLRFSTRILLLSVTTVALALGGWIAYSKHRLNQLAGMRREGAIVIVRNGTPPWLQSIGVKQLSPFYSVSTVELYVTPMGSEAVIGVSDRPLPRDEAKSRLLDQANEARGYGSKDIQLISLGDLDRDWMAFAESNSLTVVSDSKERYLKRLAANQETGADVNP